MTCDALIVGAGSAGCALAARLSEDAGRRVTLVEAGDWPRDPRVRDPAAWPLLQGSEIDWRFETIAQSACAGRVHPWPRGLAVGGSSCIHAMAHMRGHPRDFDAWPEGWRFADLEPCCRRSENWTGEADVRRGQGGPMHLIQPSAPHPLALRFLEAGAECGVPRIADHNGPAMSGMTLNTLTIKDGERQTVADAYLTPDVLARPNLTLMIGGLVDRLEDGPTGAWKSVRLADGGVLSAERAVILCAGAIGSPAILMRSGIGPEDALGEIGVETLISAPGVGENLHDHLLSAGNVYRATKPVPPSKYQHSESLAYLAPDAQGQPQVAVACVAVPVVSEMFASVEIGSAYTLMFGVCHPNSRGRLRLASTDPTAKPMLDPAYLSAPDDRARSLEALDWARRLGAASAFADWRAEELLPTPTDLSSDAARLAFVEKAAFTHHHPVGTCRMGDVVDATLAVNGAEGLYVVDASVFPSITTGPVNATVIALAERAAELLPAQGV